MPGDHPYSRLPAVPPLNPLRFIPQRAKRRLKQLGHTLRHTLRLSCLASGSRLIDATLATDTVRLGRATGRVSLDTGPS